MKNCELFPELLEQEELRREIEVLKKKLRDFELENRAIKKQLLLGMKAFDLIDSCVDIINLMQLETPELAEWRMDWL